MYSFIWLHAYKVGLLVVTQRRDQGTKYEATVVPCFSFLPPLVGDLLVKKIFQEELFFL
jgi:hypothetical protein